MPLITTARRFVPPRLLPFARFVYHLPAWLAPPFVTHASRRISFARATRPTRHEAAVLARNAKFENMYAGRRCFVIGNGPSLNKQDLSPLGNEITIAMNWFNRHPIIERWKPTIFCMAEPAEYIKKWDHSSLAPLLKGIDAQWYFFRVEVRTLPDSGIENLPQDRVHYFKMPTSSRMHLFSPRRYDLRLTKVYPGCCVTPQMAIMIAMYMGCSPIYLLGLDHDHLSYKTAADTAHFYEGAPKLRDRNLFGQETASYLNRMRHTVKTWEAYEWIREAASHRGTQIYNATTGGCLDVYPRVQFESLFGSDDALPTERP